jgi:predicted metal-binding membrane protein
MKRLVATALAWAILLAASPGGLTWLCGEGGLISSIRPWDAARLLSLDAMWAVMAVAMMLPCLAVTSRDRKPIAQITMAAFAGGLAHWILESTGVLSISSAVENDVLRVALLLAIALAELAKWQRRSITAISVQMICLQFLGGAMDLGWMAVITLWMLADEMLRREFSPSTTAPSPAMRDPQTCPEAAA